VDKIYWREYLNHINREVKEMENRSSNRSSKCDNKEVQRELGGEIYQSIECPRPEGLRCKMNKSPCAYPFYYKSLTFEESGEDEKIKKAKKILLEEIKELYEKVKITGYMEGISHT